VAGAISLPRRVMFCPLLRSLVDGDYKSVCTISGCIVRAVTALYSELVQSLTCNQESYHYPKTFIFYYLCAVYVVQALMAPRFKMCFLSLAPFPVAVCSVLYIAWLHLRGGRMLMPVLLCGKFWGSRKKITLVRAYWAQTDYSFSEIYIILVRIPSTGTSLW